jgi:hypothetical protein
LRDGLFFLQRFSWLQLAARKSARRALEIQANSPTFARSNFGGVRELPLVV